MLTASDKTCSAHQARHDLSSLLRTLPTGKVPHQRGPSGPEPGDGVIESGRQSRRRLVSPSEAMPTRDDLHYLIPVPYLLFAITRTIRPNMCEVALHITATYDLRSQLDILHLGNTQMPEPQRGTDESLDFGWYSVPGQNLAFRPLADRRSEETNSEKHGAGIPSVTGPSLGQTPAHYH